jgi:hypothetical protein
MEESAALAKIAMGGVCLCGLYAALDSSVLAFLAESNLQFLTLL